ncbi:MAG: Gfo/Idh/MocA family oxidoreductase [Planctomycetales bacterium]
MKQLRGVCIGAGYFSQFHLEAWARIPEVEIAGLCDVDPQRAEERAQEFGIGETFTRAEEAIEKLQPDFVDIITRSETHGELVELAAKRGIAVICQKPLAPDFDACRRLVESAEQAGVPLMVHENFRFQPWHREMKRLIESGVIGDQLHSLHFRSRPGDGWGADAYLARQPYFREMPRFLVFETGVHIIDTFRFLGGEINETYAILRRLNAGIRGEDAGLLTFRFANGAVGVWDANRYNEGTAADPRLTFGELLIEGNGGSLRLYPDGRITLQSLGYPEKEHTYFWEQRSYAGDCVHAVQRHFIEQLLLGGEFETSGRKYLRTLEVQEAVYRSAAENRPVRIGEIQ